MKTQLTHGDGFGDGNGGSGSGVIGGRKRILPLALRATLVEGLPGQVVNSSI